LTTGLPHLRLRTAAALALSLPAWLLALPALAQGHKAACATHGHTAHVHCLAHHHEAPNTHADKRHHGAHGVLVTHPRAPVLPRSAATILPTCEDGSAPFSARHGSAACADGSEPACADGSNPANGACPVSTDEGTGGPETTCEGAADTCGSSEEDAASLCREGSPPSPSGEGPSFVCEG
jgi:hypothetical protein